ncbi:BRO family protein [Clostridium sp. VAP52]|uniref:BRO-N domain-containing protein n=1 Tax=Clostridium sp. VAP52 TaxID=2949977 RepID=UPI00207A8340|nr:BRO family protein [Clostridium sp. VAP52]
MSKELQIFKNEDFGQVKVIRDDNGEPLFELYSVGIALGYSRIKIVKGKEYREIQKTRINQVMKNGAITGFPHGGETYLNEDMLYDFIFEAKTQKSRPFRKWVTSEVLPTLRKTGSYSLDKEKNDLTNIEQIAINVFGAIDNRINKLDEYYKPKHKTKLNFNKFIKECLGDNATKENCKKAKETLLTLLGNYTIYEEVPIEKLQNQNTLATLYDICKNINNSIKECI